MLCLRAGGGGGAGSSGPRPEPGERGGSRVSREPYEDPVPRHLDLGLRTPGPWENRFLGFGVNRFAAIW